MARRLAITLALLVLPLAWIFATHAQEHRSDAAMTLTVDTRLSPGTTVTLPLAVDGTVDVVVSWGDGQQSIATSRGNLSHSCAAEGVYTIAIEGTLQAFGTWPTSYPGVEKLTGVLSYCDLGLIDLSGAFRDAVNLALVPDHLPPTVVRLAATFAGATSFDHDMGGWDTSNVTDMRRMFHGAASFDQDLSRWCVSRIGAEPSAFATGATSWVLPKPMWGTCP